MATFTASYSVTQADLNNGSIKDTASATGTNPPNIGGPVSATSNEVTVTATQNASLSIVKATTTTSVSHVSDSIPYTFTVTNTGNVTLTAVGVTDLPISPAGLTTSPVCTGLTSPTASCTSSSSTALAPGQVAHFTASYSVTQADLNNGSINDKSSATGTNPAPLGGTTTATSNEVTVTATQNPLLTSVKSSTTTSVTNVGDTISYQFVVTNAGNVTITNVGVTDNPVSPAGSLTSGPTCVSLANPTGTCSGSTVASLAPGQSATFSATYTVTQADLDNGSVSDTATASGTAPNDSPVTGDSNEVTVPVNQTPSISVSKTADPTTVSAVGQTVTYTFVVTNTGNVTLSNASVADVQTAPAGSLTSGPTCVSLANPTGTCSGSTASSLAPGQSATFTATYTVTQADLDNGTIKDTATASGTPPNSQTPVTGGGTATVDVTRISVVKSASPSAGVVAGSTTPIDYTLTVSNTGTSTTTAPITVTDAAPTGTTLVSGSPKCATGGPPDCTVAVSSTGTITWTIPAGVAPGASYTLTFSVTANASDATGTITNSATWSGPSCGTPVAPVTTDIARATTTTCPTNTTSTSVTSAPVTTPAVTTTTTTTAPPKTAVSTTPPIAFTGALLSEEWLASLAALALGATLMVIARTRRRTPKHAAPKK